MGNDRLKHILHVTSIFIIVAALTNLIINEVTERDKLQLERELGIDLK
jgi:hypothetical protein